MGTNSLSNFVDMLHALNFRGSDIEEPSDMYASKDCSDLVDLHNKTREVFNLPKLEIGRKCCVASQAHSVWMAASRNVCHLGFGFFGPAQRLAIVGEEPALVGECISSSLDTSVSSMMKQWYCSGTHKAIILGDYTHFGMGMTLGSDGQAYWCALYTNTKNDKGTASVATSDSLVDL